VTARGQMTILLRGNKRSEELDFVREWWGKIQYGIWKGQPTVVESYFLSWAFVAGRRRGQEIGGIEKRVLPVPGPTNRGGKSNRARMLWLDTGDT
jgi:hypothetical protein